MAPEARTVEACTPISVYMIGDSTMSLYGAELYPRMGWGQPFAELFAPECVRVVDKALSGRSSKSFSDEGAWSPIRAALRAGDYVLIQFGHNDEKSFDPSRYTSPGSSYKQYLTGYVNDTRERRAIPILLTPIIRNSWNGQTLNDTHGDYPNAMRELASELHVELIDLTVLTQRYFERLGPSEASKLFMNLEPGEFPNYPNGSQDNTHLRETGARAIGRLVMWDAASRKLTLAKYLKQDTVLP